jgi:hypothetical protein
MLLLAAALPEINYLSELLKQGPVIGLLGIAILYFYRRQQQLEGKLDKVNEKYENYLTDDREQLMKIIENNTTTMLKIEKHLDK